MNKILKYSLIVIISIIILYILFYYIADSFYISKGYYIMKCQKLKFIQSENIHFITDRYDNNIKLDYNSKTLTYNNGTCEFKLVKLCKRSNGWKAILDINGTYFYYKGLFETTSVKTVSPTGVRRIKASCHPIPPTSECYNVMVYENNYYQCGN